MNQIDTITKTGGEMKAFFGTIATGGAAGATWLVDVDLWLRVVASAVAIVVGCLTAVYYWKKIRNLNKLDK